MLDRRTLVVSVALLAALAAVAATPQLGGARVGRALDELAGAKPGWLWLAAVGFLAGSFCAAAAWRSALVACGGRLDRVDAAARYGIGALVNSFAPARLGDAVRIGLFSRALQNRERLWTAGSVWAAVAATRALVLAVLVVVASASGAMPVLPVLALAGGVAALVALSVLARGRASTSRFAHVFDAFRALICSPRDAARVIGWVAGQTTARVLAAAAVAASLGVGDPLAAALLIVPALELAGLLPLTPGNLGITSGAVAVALRARGIDLTTALSTGIAFHAVETIAGVAFGLAGGLLLVGYPSPAVRRLALGASAAAACVGAAAMVGATVFDVI